MRQLPKPATFPLAALAALAVVDALLQVGVLWLPSPFAGIGLAGFVLLPVVLAWYLFVLVAILAALPLAYLCLRRRWLAPLGAVLLVLSALNLVQAWR